MQFSAFTAMITALAFPSFANASALFCKEAPATLVESCYSAGDTDLSQNPGSQIPGNTPISIQIFADARGYYAQISNQATKEIIADKMPVDRDHSRGDAAWTYTTPAQLPNQDAGKIALEIYRTNEDARNPTSVNAHVRHFSQGTMKIKASRLECLKLGL